MCLKIKSGPHKAKKAFYTLKIGETISEKGYKSYIRGNPQKFGQKLKAKIRPLGGEINAGIHSLYKFKKEYWNGSFDDKWGNRGIILCKIPRGTTYYIGLEGDVVSELLIPVEPICISGSALKVKGGRQISLSELDDALKASFKVVKKLGYNIKPS